MRFRLLTFLVFFIGVSACSKQEGPTVEKESLSPVTADSSAASGSNSQHEHDDGIQWFDGTVEQAFAAATEQKKPLLLYWGAVWCPPCNQLKATVFKQRKFIDQTRLFIPVYLDGDTQGAQIYGEKFAVRGYPTLIAFDSKGTEVTRIPGGMDLQRYENVMDLVLGEIRPVKDIVQSVIDGKQASLSEKDFKLLAYYSWSQDNLQVLDEGAAAKTLAAIYHACPESLKAEKSRLLFDYLYFLAVEKQKQDEPLLLDDVQRLSLRQAVSSVLQSQRLSEENVYAIRYEDGELIKMLSPDQSEERKALANLWLEALLAFEGSSRLSKLDRLGSLYAQVTLAKMQNNAQVGEALEDKIRETINLARENVENKYEHSAIVNMSRNILVHAGMHAFAEEMIAEEVDKASSPYYFMLELADFAKKEGRTDEALQWMKKAYEASPDGATRFQWGVNYLKGLTELTPEDEATIQQLASNLLAKLSESKDGFYNRNLQRLASMEKALQAWNEGGQHAKTLKALREQILLTCKALEENSAAQNQCNGFLVQAS